MSEPLRLGTVIRPSDRAYLVAASGVNGKPCEVWVPRSICQTTREGFPLRTVVWAPTWFMTRENLREERLQATGSMFPTSATP